VIHNALVKKVHNALVNKARIDIMTYRWSTML